MSKLVPHIIQSSGPAMTWAQHAPFYKVLDGTGPGVRKWWPDDVQQQLVQQQSAQKVFDDIMSLVGSGTTWVFTMNETCQHLGGGLEQLCDLLTTLTPMFHAKGLKVAGPGWSTGNPELADVAYLASRNWCGLDALDFHCYFGTQGFDQWYALRYRWLLSQIPQPHPKVIIGETGIDGVPGGARGWKNAGISADDYLKLLATYDVELQKDADVLWACVFTAGPTPDWAAYSTDELDMSRFYSIPTAGGPTVADEAPYTEQEVMDALNAAGAGFSDAQGDASLADNGISQMAIDNNIAPNDWTGVAHMIEADGVWDQVQNDYPGVGQLTLRGVTYGHPITPGTPAAPPTPPTPTPAMPVPQPIDQGQTYLCGLYALLECFTASGAPFDYAAVYQDVKGKPYVAPGEPATFQEVAAYLQAAAKRTGATVQLFGADGFARDDATRLQLVRDGWYVITGVQEPSGLEHYVVEVQDAPGAVTVVDSYPEDGSVDHLGLEAFNQAVHAFPSGDIEALAFKITSVPAPAQVARTPAPLTVGAQLVTMLSVIGDKTYATPVDIIGIRVLVQQAKALLGAK